MTKKYNKKNNMKQAMYEMFGVGEEQTEAALYQEPASDEEAPVLEATEAEAVQTEAASEPEMTFEQMIGEYAPLKKSPASFLAPGTVFEGILHSAGDVEIAGEFNGDVTSEGNVVLRSAVCGNVSCVDLKLESSILVGDVDAKGSVAVSEDSKVRGNIAATEVECAGQINGDLNVTGDTALEKTALIKGFIKTGTMSMEKGAMIKGGIEMDPPAGNNR